MNRTLILGIAMFLAVVGIALLGGEKVAVAGHGCCCGGDCCCGGGGCCGGCHCHGLFHHRHRCCCGGDCCGGGCCGGAPSCGGEAPSCGGEKAAPAPAPPAPMTSIQSDRAPFAFSHVSYRR